MKAENTLSCLDATAETLSPEQKSEKIRMLNDCLRRTGQGGKVFVTDGIVALGAEFARAVLAAVTGFDEFSGANDPHREHDFGSVDVMSHRVFFKIDYYDRTGTVHSPDPTTNKVTLRVMTIMLASEY